MTHVWCCCYNNRLAHLGQGGNMIFLTKWLFLAIFTIFSHSSSLEFSWISSWITLWISADNSPTTVDNWGKVEILPLKQPSMHPNSSNISTYPQGSAIRTV